jgi:RNA polymerase sigma factor (sigma-70 family)
VTVTLSSHSDEWILRAQNGEVEAVEGLLDQFRPLIKSRTHALWTAAGETVSGMEWADVEAEVTLLFLSRLQNFRPEQGVYFPHYIERMLYFDGLAWLRQQRKGAAVPFSQLGGAEDVKDDDIEQWIFQDCGDVSREVEQTLALRDGLAELPAMHKQLVWQCCVLGRSEAEVAQSLSMSRSTVRSRLTQALNQLRAYFGGADGETGQQGRGAQREDSHHEFWHFIFLMAKDEKRPDLVGVGSGRPVLLQGTFDFPTTGLRTPQLLSTKLRYVVPIGAIAGIRYLRAGSICEKMVCLSTVVNGMPHRLIPIAPNATAYVPFAIVDALPAGSEIEIHIASEAPGTVIVDVGCLQMPA